MPKHDKSGLSWWKRLKEFDIPYPDGRRPPERRIAIRRPRLDASYQVRRLAVYRKKIYPDISMFLELMNEGLQLFRKKAAAKDIEAIEEGNVMDLDMLVVYSQMLGTRVMFDGADQTALIHLPDAQVRKRLAKVMEKAHQAKRLAEIDDMAFEALSIAVIVMSKKGERLRRTQLRVSDKVLCRSILSALVSSKLGELTKLEEEFRTMGVEVLAKKG